MMTDDRTPEVWFKTLPPITRFILTGSFFITLFFSIRLFNPTILLLDWPSVYRKLQTWRLFTDYLFSGPFSFGWLMHMYLFVTFSSKLEVNELFTASPGAYLTFMVFQMLTLDMISLCLYWPTGKPLMSPGLVSAIIYYWSRREPWGNIGLWGFTVQAYQFPFALLFLDVLLGNSVWVSLMGLTSGHLFYFLKDVLPQEKGIDLLGSTPRFMDELMIRLSSFDFSDTVGSTIMLFKGTRPRVVAGRQTATVQSNSSFGARTASSQQPGGTASSTSNNSSSTQLFSGPGQRLGSS